MFVGLAVSDCGLSVLQTCVSVLLEDLFSLCMQVCRHSWKTSSLVVLFVYVALWHRISSGTGVGVADRNQKTPVPGCSWVIVSSGFRTGSSEQQGLSYLCSQASPHSWEVSYLPVPPGYGALWQRIQFCNVTTIATIKIIILIFQETFSEVMMQSHMLMSVLCQIRICFDWCTYNFAFSRKE